jgi:hypothetical protein
MVWLFSAKVSAQTASLPVPNAVSEQQIEARAGLEIHVWEAVVARQAKNRTPRHLYRFLGDRRDSSLVMLKQPGSSGTIAAGCGCRPERRSGTFSE